MLEGIFDSSQPSTLPMIFRLVIKFLRPVASLLTQVNIEGSIVVASLRLFELITRKTGMTDNWTTEEKKQLEIALGELLCNYKQFRGKFWIFPTHRRSP